MTGEDPGVNTHALTQVPAHRVVLAARSEYFRALFDGDMSDSKAPSVSLTTLSQEVALVSRAASNVLMLAGLFFMPSGGVGWRFGSC